MHPKIVVANLDRRPDRWYVCLGALVGLGYDPEFIERFSAHDGDQYDSFDEVRKASLEQFPHSTYLRTSKLATHYYCWSWTWYDIMSQIANSTHGDLTLLLVDDFSPGYYASEMKKYLHALNSISPIKCVQLWFNDYVGHGYSKTEDVFPPGAPVPGVPFTRKGFTHEIHAAGDAANIISPEGAREIIAIADNHENLGVPNLVFWWVAKDLSNFDGYYTADGCHYRFLGNQHVNPFQDGRYF